MVRVKRNLRPKPPPGGPSKPRASSPSSPPGSSPPGRARTACRPGERSPLGPLLRPHRAPALRDAGWQIDCPPGFRHRVCMPTDWHVRRQRRRRRQAGSRVAGHRSRRPPARPRPHAPRGAPARPPLARPKKIEAIRDDAKVIVELDEGERVALPAGRIKPIARTLVDLFDSPAPPSRYPASTPRGSPTPWARAGRAWPRPCRPDDSNASAAPPSSRPVPVPAGFALDLRPYQLEGLAWLQHLRDHGFGGILADDMGLGKTARPSPTCSPKNTPAGSTKPRPGGAAHLAWSSTGSARPNASPPRSGCSACAAAAAPPSFAKIPEHDVCLTTYPALVAGSGEARRPRLPLA